MKRREALKWMASATAFRAMGPSLSLGLGLQLEAQSPVVDWSARISSLPQRSGNEIVITAVGDLIRSSPAADRPAPEVQQMYRVIRESDVGFGNCEEAISSIGFYGQRVADPSMLDDFKAVGLNMLSLSNNHFMDLGPKPALQGLEEMRKHGFTVAGAGADLDAALAPGIKQVKGVRVGLLSFWCAPNNFGTPAFMEGSRAGINKPGQAMIVGYQVLAPGSQVPVLLPLASDMKALKESVARAKAQVDFLMVSFHQHWGVADGGGQGIIPPREAPRRTTVIPANLSAPRNEVSAERKLILRAAVDAGADLVLGHGPHILNGIEIYKGKPIVYSLGHFYIEGMKDGKALPQFLFSPSMVTQIENGWWQEEQQWSVIARIFVQGNRVTRLDLIPITMDIQKDGLPNFPSEAVGKQIVNAVRVLSKPLGTEVRAHDWYAEVTGLDGR
jgi:poly-gamma-glutamate capsule biosynthesis protein CapA/YwtB (metallophosphatase superfamily)